MAPRGILSVGAVPPIDRHVRYLRVLLPLLPALFSCEVPGGNCDCGPSGFQFPLEGPSDAFLCTTPGKPVEVYADLTFYTCNCCDTDSSFLVTAIEEGLVDNPVQLISVSGVPVSGDATFRYQPDGSLRVGVRLVPTELSPIDPTDGRPVVMIRYISFDGADRCYQRYGGYGGIGFGVVVVDDLALCPSMRP